MVVKPFEKGLFDKLYAEHVDYGTYGVNDKNANNSMQVNISRIMPCVIERISPKPLTHSIAISMNQQNTESGCCNGIDDLAIADFQVFEK